MWALKDFGGIPSEFGDVYYTENWPNGYILIHYGPSPEYREMLIKEYRKNGHNWLFMSGYHKKILQDAGLIDVE